MSQSPSSARAGVPPERPPVAALGPGPGPVSGPNPKPDIELGEFPERNGEHFALGRKSVVLVGLMGVGKTTIGRHLAAALRTPFRDSDDEVERAAGRTVAEIFAERGEAEFRAGERRVIARLLTQEPAHVLAFGGGAFMNPETRALVRSHAISVWLKADLELLARRVARKPTRPLVQGRNPLDVLKAQAEARLPIYAEADVVVEAGEGPAAQTAEAVIEALSRHLALGAEVAR